MSEDTQEDADRLEATRREVERLTKLRRDVASGLLEVSEAAKRDAERLLSATADTPGSGEVPPRPTDAEPSRVRSSPLLYGSFAIGILCGFLLAIFLRTPELSPVDDVAVVDQAPPETPFDSAEPEAVEQTASTDSEQAPPSAPTPEPPAVSTAGADTAGGLVLTLRTHRTCWLSVRVDDGETIERLLPPGETVVLQVEEEAVLRIGDAAALSLLINDRPTGSLGADGQVVQLRITPSNFQAFLNG